MPGGPTDPDNVLKVAQIADTVTGGRIMLGEIGFALRVSGGAVGPSPRWEVATDGDVSIDIDTLTKLKESSPLPGNIVLHNRLRYTLDLVDGAAELQPA